MIHRNRNLKNRIRLRGFAALFAVCLFYWIFDSIWSYLSFEYNLKTMIFGEPASYFDTLLLRVTPYQIVNRLSVTLLFLILGSVLIEFFIKRQTAEKEAREARDTLLGVMNSIDATIYVADMETHEILFMNKHMIDIFGGDHTGGICYEVFRNNPEACADCSNDHLLDASGQPAETVVWEGENPVTGRWHLNHDRAIRWIDGRMVRLQIATDITQLKELQKQQLEAEARMREAQKMESIGTLAGGIAHDFNNILSPIIGLSDLLIEDLPPGSTQHENAAEILRAGRRGRDLVRQILSFGRKYKHQKAPLEIQHVVKEVLKLIRSTIPSDIDITSDIQKNCGMVMADPTQMHQIVMNLLTNAYHAVEPAAGGISVSLRETRVGNPQFSEIGLEPGRYAVLSVSDTGCGIGKEFLDKIFEPYFTTKKEGKGTGLGLSVVYGIVKDHGGDIKVNSEVGKGTVFNVYLPLIARRNKSVLRKEETQAATGDERILLIDDETSITRLVTQMLERLGYTVTAFNRSTDALKTFEADPHAFDLVITDMAMPVMTGDRLSREMLQLRPDLPIIMCTGFSSRISEKEAKAMGIKGYMMKPPVRSEITRLIRSVLDSDA